MVEVCFNSGITREGDGTVGGRGMTATGDSFIPYNTAVPSGPYGDPFGTAGSQAALPHTQPFQRGGTYDNEGHKSMRHGHSTGLEREIDHQYAPLVHLCMCGEDHVTTSLSSAKFQLHRRQGLSSPYDRFFGQAWL